MDTGLVDDVLCIVETKYGTGVTQHGPHIRIAAVPNMERVGEMLEPGDVIWCRGGFKSWYDHLEAWGRARHWLLVYAANTGREKWPFWDVIFDDLTGGNFLDRTDRRHLDFRKPTKPDIFRPLDLKERYDLCIGASHIHDRKGQWRAVKAAAAYHDCYGQHLRCVMPGGMRRGTRTSQIMADIEENDLDIDVCGMLSRSDLAAVFNESRLFCHLGSHGQGDRGVMEAMRCGCRVIIGYPRYHAPWAWRNRRVCWVPDYPNDFEWLARGIFRMLEYQDVSRQEVFDYHEAQASIENVILPDMRRLFAFFKANPVANDKARAAFKGAYGL